MMKSIQFFVLVMFLGCSGTNDKNQQTIISIDAGAGVLDSLNLNRFSLGTLKLASIRLDSLGRGKADLSLTEPTMCYFTLLNEGYEFYLSPGDKIRINIGKENSGSNHSVVYSGSGSGFNNFLAVRRKEINKVSRSRINPKLTTEKYLFKIDSFKNVLARGADNFSDTANVSDEVLGLVKRMNQVDIAAFKLEHVLMLESYSLYEQTLARDAGQAIVPFIPPQGFEKVGDEIPLDSEVLKIGYAQYRHLLFLGLTHGIYNPAYDVMTWETEKTFFPAKSEKLIEARPYPADIKEYLMAANVNYWMGIYGLSNPSVDSIYFSFIEKFSTSVYYPELKAVFNKWETIAPGKQAPTITGLTTEEKLIKLSELKGRVIYIDVWATWCAPCREEFPHMKNLQKEFANNEKVVFLNVSVDSNIEAWKKMVASGKTPAGLHIVNDGSIYGDYLISGIPHYILIDQQGKIVNADAARPSSGKAGEDIKNLIQ
ncbi:MAG: TlpA family protein disulfide reductase [Cyclobacteriaceae bacterium]|nr:TlpA family protein disulfide reductase [Cyclobacteriaceae bacterium]